MFYQEDGGVALLQAFYADIQKYQGGGDSDNWVGNWLAAHRIDTENLYCRGFIENCELNGGHVRIDMETAWASLPEVWDLMAEKYNLSYVYISEECGCEVYVNTDSAGRWFSTRYVIQIYDDCDSETVYCDSFDEVLEELDLEAKDMEDLKKRLAGRNICVYEYSSE